jgi:excisionase family DNA binding protein
MMDHTRLKSAPYDKTMPDLNEFMTTQEADEKLDLTVRAVNRLVASKKLEGIRVGRMYLISRVSVKSYLDKTRDMSKNDPRRKTITE